MTDRLYWLTDEAATIRAGRVGGDRGRLRLVGESG